MVDPATGYTDTAYTWLSGPNKEYRFGIGGPPNPSLEDHKQAVREFLAMVDPTTGYVRDRLSQPPIQVDTKEIIWER